MQLVQETATVSFIKDGYAYLKTAGASSCGKCSAKSSCGSVNLFKPKIESDSHLRIANTQNLKAGDSVVLSMAVDKLLLGTVLMYLLPLFTLFLFAVIGKFLGGEIVSIFTGLGGLIAGLFLVKKIVVQARVAKQFEPTILRKVISIETE